MKELTIDRGELKMIMSYCIGTSEVTKILGKYDDGGNKGGVISGLISEICYQKFAVESLRTRLVIVEARLVEARLGTTVAVAPERD
jgi:hypothetical protein